MISFRTSWTAFATLVALLTGLGAARPVSGRPAPRERIWIAGRYDARRVVIYFGTAHFHDTVPASTRKIRPPVADGFFDPVELSSVDMHRFADTVQAERFDVGDRYDLLLDSGHVAEITLTSLVAFYSDEQVGNDSYVGALGTIDSADLPFFSRDYYVARPPHTVRARASRIGIREPPTAETRAHIVSLLRARLQADSDSAVRHDARSLPLNVLDVTSFALADGSLRYYARATLRTRNRDACTKVEAWLVPSGGTTRIRLAAYAAGTCRFDVPEEVPRLLNLVSLGDGRIGLIAELIGVDGRSLDLYEYTDGNTFARMRLLGTITAGE